MYIYNLYIIYPSTHFNLPIFTPLCTNFLQPLHYTLNVVTILIICQRNLCPGAAGDSDRDCDCDGDVDFDCDCKTLEQQQKELKKFAAVGFVGFFCSANPIFLIVCRRKGSERRRGREGRGKRALKVCVCAGGG